MLAAQSGEESGVGEAVVMVRVILQAAQRRGGLPRARAVSERRGENGERRCGRVARGRGRKKM